MTKYWETSKKLLKFTILNNFLSNFVKNKIDDVITDLLVDLEVKMRFGGDEIGGDSRFFDFLGSKNKFLLA